jgi:hypothetical protein
MELIDFFPIDGNLSMEDNLSQMPAEINNGAIFSWKYGLYTKKVLEEIKLALQKYGFDYEIDNPESKKTYLIFTKAFPELFELVLNKNEDQHIYLFLTEKELEDNSNLKSFFYFNEKIDYNLLASCFLEDGTWSQIIDLHEKGFKDYLWGSLVKFKQLQKERDLNPSFLFEIKDEESAKFVWKRVYNETNN